jgi:hypothetical protein
MSKTLNNKTTNAPGQFGSLRPADALELARA